MNASRLAAALVLAVAAPALAADPSSAPPAARVAPVTASYQGISITDPYRWLEKLDDPEVRRWLAAQGSFTRHTLDRIPALAALDKRVEELDASMPVHIGAMQRTAGGRVFYSERKQNEPLAKLYVREGLSGAPRLLYDPDEGLTHGGKREAINRWSASPDGKWVALLTAPADAELGAMRIRNVATGQDVGKPIPQIWGELGATWRADSRGFYYTRSAPDGQPIDTKHLFGKMVVFERALDEKGAPAGADVARWGFAVAGAPTARATDWPGVYEIPGSTFVVGGLNEGVHQPARIWAIERKELAGAAPRWRAIADEKQGVRDYTSAGHWLYAKTFVDAPRFRIIRYDLAAGGAPVEVVPQQKGVIEQLSAAADGLYYVVREGATADLWFLPHGRDAKSAKKLTLPWRGSPSINDAEPDVAGALVSHDAWTRQEAILAVDAARGVHDTGLIPATTLGRGADLASVEATCKAPDGALVPMSIIGKKGWKRDGNHPVLLDGYGGYGFTSTAYYSPTWRAWYELGGLIVSVNPRGSGAWGEEWYQAGRGAKKSNTWKDMIACAETLIAEKYTTPKRLAIRGISMGGVAVGRAITTRPDLFGVAIVQVGITDAIRFIEATPNGPNHELEMGSLATRAGVEQLLEMSTYHHIVDGTKYPATLVIQGMNDNRVAPWISFKTAARLQAATGSKLPVLLRTDLEGGHGVTTTSQQRNSQWADTIAFAMWQFGLPAYEPAEPKARTGDVNAR